ncbi:MAG: hypothetical protein IPG07_20210 [Crocinitomicaceae bacterium]|nr:hypothetical protein [Crocinitomicaceae bacterium]
MIKKKDWINETLRQLESFGAVVESKSNLNWKVNDQLISFIPAKSENNSGKENTILIHEDLFHTRKNQLFMRLKSQLGLNENRIHGRSTRVVEITRKQAEKFVEENHLLGYNSGKLFLGLMHKDDLVAVAIFSRMRFMKYEEPTYNSTELERFCSLANTTVVGGLDKLINYFSKNYKSNDLVTMIDLEWSEGKSYLNLGFEEVMRTQPILFAVNEKTFERRVILSKEDLKKSEYLIQNRGNVKLRKWISKTS